MKKLLMKLAIWYLNKCKVQPIEIGVGKYFLVHGKLFQISYWASTKTWEEEKITVEANLVF